MKQTLENHIDNTGNIRVWPSEEFLAVWCLMQTWEGKRVLELGAGKSGLAGLAVDFKNGETLITDGNLECVNCLEKLPRREKCKVGLLEWGTEMKEEFDIVLIADCLFFKDYHDALIQTLKSILKGS